MSEKNHDDKEHKKSHGGHGHGAGHGGGSHEEHEGAPEWLISFADNVTLMMGFFVILLAINMKPAGGGKGEGDGTGQAVNAALLDTQIAVREAFNNPVDLSSANPNDLPLIRRIRQKLEEGYAENPNAKGEEHDVQSIRPGDRHEIGGGVRFDNDTAALTEAAKKDIDELAKVLRGKMTVIDVRGHTSAAEAYKAGDKGMRLSFDRAFAVGRRLAEQGVDWRQLRIVAYGDNDRIRPIAYHKTEQRVNAFVEVVATDEPMRVYTPQDDPAAAPAGK